VKVVIDAYWNQQGIPKGRVGLTPDSAYTKQIAAFLNKIKEKEKTGEAVRLKVTLEEGRKPRNLDQNALMWSLYGIESNEMNGGRTGAGAVTADSLYLNDLSTYAERMRIRIPITQKDLLSRHFKHYVIISGDENFIVAEGLLSTSLLDTREMAEWINRIFDRLSAAGVHLDESADIKKYWLDWRQMLNDKKIILHDEVMTQAEYKERQPVCEATGDYLGEGGSLHHIKAVGMGGDRTKEPARNYTSNWLHLSDKVHLEDAPGWQKFIEKYPHLSHKVKSALKRDYEPIEENLELF